MYGFVLLFVQIATAAAAALVCLFVVLFVVTDVFIAVFAACLCLADPLGAARHGGQRRPRRRRDPPACVWRRVLGGFGGRLLGRAQNVRSCLDLALGWRVFGCWTVCPEPRVGGVRVGGIRVVAGRVGAGGWVGGWVGGLAGGNAVCSGCFVVVVVADVCGCRLAGLGM